MLEARWSLCGGDPRRWALCRGEGVFQGEAWRAGVGDGVAGLWSWQKRVASGQKRALRPRPLRPGLAMASEISLGALSGPEAGSQSWWVQDGPSRGAM